MASEADAVADEFDKCVHSRDAVQFRRAVRKMRELAERLGALDVSMPVVTTESDDRDKVAELATENRDVMIRGAFWMHEGALSQAQKATESDWDGGGA